MSPGSTPLTQADDVAVVEVRDVHKTYRRGSEEVHALRGVSMTLHPGEVVVLMGPSGSGKSTLLNVLCGWERPERGEVVWMSDPSGPSPDLLLWNQIAIVPQNLGLMEELSVRENVSLPIRLGGTGSMEDVDDLLSAFGLDHLANRSPWEISLGEQQRTALARALVLAPRLLLADEPTGHQDEAFARRVLRVMRAATEIGTTCLIASHNEEALRIADRVLSIRDGVLQGTHAAIEEEQPATWSPPR
jgi:ABC-type lipoprotein export system ATPase subunit